MEIKIIQKSVKRNKFGIDMEHEVAEVYIDGVLICTNYSNKYDKIGDMIATILHGNDV